MLDVANLYQPPTNYRRGGKADLAANGLVSEAGAGAAADVDPEADGQGELPRMRGKTVKQEKRKVR